MEASGFEPSSFDSKTPNDSSISHSFTIIFLIMLDDKPTMPHLQLLTTDQSRGVGENKEELRRFGLWYSSWS